MGGDEDLLNIFKLIYRYRVMIMSITLAIAIITAIVSLNLPKTYTATAVALPPEVETLQRGGNILSYSYSDIFGEGVNDSGVVIAMLKSRRMAEYLVKEFDLVEKYKMKSFSSAIQRLQSETMVIPTKEKTIMIIVNSTSPELAADLANSYVYNLDEINNELKITPAKPVARLLDKAYPPESKSKPKIKNNIIIASVIALILSIGFVFLVEYFKAIKNKTAYISKIK